MTRAYTDELKDFLDQLKARFDDKILEKRDGPKRRLDDGTWVKKTFFYIPVDNLQERLDEVFGLNWAWEVSHQSVIEVEKEKKQYENGRETGKELVKEKQVIVVGKLTLFLPDGRSVSRDGCGGCDSTHGMSAGDAFKIADSNAFRKACHRFGMGRYLSLEGRSEKEEPSVGGGGKYRNNNYPSKAAPATTSAGSGPNPFTNSAAKVNQQPKSNPFSNK